MKELTKLDKLNIYASCNLSNDDYYSLSLLYQPLIGSTSLGVYFTLNSLLERNNLKSESYFHHNLFDILNMDEKSFLDARLKLEAIGLMETFFKDDEYVYLLKQPLTPNQFLKDSTFGLYLCGTIGKVMYDILKNHFKIESIDRKSLENITINFNEVFSSEVPDLETIDKDTMMLGRKPNKSVKIENHEFDFEEFLCNIDDSYLENGVTPAFKKVIIDTSFVYGFDEGDMESLYKRSLGSDHYFDVKALRKAALELYNAKTNTKTPPILSATVRDKNYFFMESVVNRSTPDFLESFSPNYPKSYLTTIDLLYRNIDLPREVVTTMIYYVLIIKEGVLPSVQYFKSMAKQWIDMDIITKDSAFEYVKNNPPIAESEKKTKSYTKKEPKLKTSDWAENNKKNIKEGFETL